jgi:hypothetical protein
MEAKIRRARVETARGQGLLARAEGIKCVSRRLSGDHCGDLIVVERRSAAALVLVVATAAALVAPARAASAPGEPVLVVMIASSDPAFRAREEQLATQLALALDDFAIERLTPEEARRGAGGQAGVAFASLSLPQKLALVGPFANKVGAVAVIWMEDGGNGAAFLHVASQRADRAFVRIVRARGGPNTEEELALAAQELIGQLYMLSTTPMDKPVAAAVERVMDEARSLHPPSVDWGALPFLAVGGGIYGHQGSSLGFGGGLAAESMIGELFFARLSVAALAGPFMKPHDGAVSGWSIEPGLVLGLSWKVSGQARLGIALGAAPVYSVAHLSLGSGDHRASDWWNFHGTVGADLRFSLGERIALVLSPSVGFWAMRRTFYRLSDDSVVLRTPFVGWSVSAGVLILIW